MAADQVVMERLAREAMQGKQDAFNELYLLTRNRAYFVAHSITHNEDDALDILQDSYLKAWMHIGDLHTPSGFAAWLNRIVGNSAKDYIKKRKPNMFVSADEDEGIDPLALQEESSAEYIPDAAMDTDETKRLIMKIVDDLPEDQRLCVLMYYYDDMSLNDIANALEVPRGTVMSRLSRARKKISEGVKTLEKKGTKLFGATPASLLLWVLRGSVMESSTLPAVILGGTATAVTGTAAATTSAFGGFAAFFTLPKIIAGAVAIAVVGGGTTAAIVNARNNAAAVPAAATAVADGSTTVQYLDETFALNFFESTVFVSSQYNAPSSSSRAQAASAAVRPTTAKSAAGNTTAKTATAASTKADTTASVKTTTAATTKAITATEATTKQTAAAVTQATTTTATTTSTTSAQPSLRTLGPINGVIVEGILPQNATLQVTTGSAFDTQINDLNAPDPIQPVATYDINLLLNGVKIQPSGNISVKLPIPAGTTDPNDLLVFHAVGAVNTEEMSVTVSGQYLVFETNYF